MQLSNVTLTARDGRTSSLEQCFLRGSKIRFMVRRQRRNSLAIPRALRRPLRLQVLPDMLKNAPMFKKVDPKHKGKGAMGMGGVGMGAGRGGGGTRRLLRLLEFAWVGKRADYRGVWAQGVVVGSGDEKSRSVETWLPRFASTGIGVRMPTVLRMERGGCFSLRLRREAHAHALRATAGSFFAVTGQRQLHQQRKASALSGRVSVSQKLRL